jgi:hypothetical protein
MKIECLHASKFGNGAMVAAEFARLMAGRGVAVEVHHIREMSPTELPQAYVFSSPGRMGKPIRRLRRFLRKLSLGHGAKYALLTTRRRRGRTRRPGACRPKRSWPGGSEFARS